jgi:hypothetical protein
VTIALALSLLLHQPYGLVETVYYFSGIDGVAVVTMESQWNARAWRREPRGFTSWGYFQIDSEWWPQYREDILLHLAQGAAILAECKVKARGDFALAVAIFNGGEHPCSYSLWWGRKVKDKRDSLMLAVRRMVR